MLPTNIARQTARWENIRGAFSGILEACWQAFALLVVIRYFDGSNMQKACLQSALTGGLLLTPLTVGWLARRGIASARACMWISLIGMVGMFISAAAWTVEMFVVSLIGVQVLMAQGMPLISHIFATNFQKHERGRYLSTALMINGLVGVVFSYFGGRALDVDISSFRGIYLMGAIACLVCAYAFQQMPSQPLNSEKIGNPWANISLIWKDKLFGAMLLGWMFMGLGNLMTLPLRVEYMANPVYGINATNEQIAMITLGIPLGCRLAFTKFWGYLFDRLNIVVVRVILNILFLFSMWAFFFTDKLWLMAVGMAFQGIGFAGGRVMWALWTTRLVPHDHVTAYVSVHTGLTGLRGALAPFIGFALIGFGNPAFAGWCAALIIAISTIIFLPLRKPIEARSQH